MKIKDMSEQKQFEILFNLMGTRGTHEAIYAINNLDYEDVRYEIEHHDEIFNSMFGAEAIQAKIAQFGTEAIQSVTAQFR